MQIVIYLFSFVYYFSFFSPKLLYHKISYLGKRISIKDYSAYDKVETNYVSKKEGNYVST